MPDQPVFFTCVHIMTQFINRLKVVKLFTDLLINVDHLEAASVVILCAYLRKHLPDVETLCVLGSNVKYMLA